MTAFYLLICVFLLTPSWVHAASLTLTVGEEAMVHKAQYTIGDIAEVDAADEKLAQRIRGIVIGQSPRAAEERSIYGKYIITRIKHHGFEPSDWTLKIPHRVQISRAFQQIEASEIEGVVKQALQREMPWQSGRARIYEMRGIEAVILPQGHATYDVFFPRQPDFIGPTAFSVAVRVDDNIEKRLHGTAYIEVAHDIVFTARPIEKYEVLTEHHIRLKQVKFSRLPRRVVTRLEGALGKRAKRSLKANQMLRANQIETRPMIRSGDVVLIIVESGALKVSVMGEALEKGERGGTIRVLNTSSKREVRAIVMDSKTVKVPF